MIVFRDNKNRNENYILCNRKLENKINFYSAIDSLNEFDKYVELAINNNLQSRDYIENNCIRTPGKLGCNLAHQLLLQEIEDKYQHNVSPEWYIILEDDLLLEGTKVEINKFLNRLINNINNYSPNSKYIQLCIYDAFYCSQVKTREVFNNTYQKINQYGTCSYMIHIDAIKKINKMRPWNNNIDLMFNSLDKEFNSLACFNKYFKCQGQEDYLGKEKKLGSLIWKNIFI